MRQKIILLTLIIVFITGCSFVKLDKNAQNVKVASTESQLENCKYLGDVTASLWNKASVFQSNKTVEEQLEILALNKATTMGGNAVIAKSVIQNAQRNFSVYKCNSNGPNL